jgi:hypothetical protein
MGDKVKHFKTTWHTARQNVWKCPYAIGVDEDTQCEFAVQAVEDIAMTQKTLERCSQAIFTHLQSEHGWDG